MQPLFLLCYTLDSNFLHTLLGILRREFTSFIFYCLRLTIELHEAGDPSCTPRPTKYTCRPQRLITGSLQAPYLPTCPKGAALSWLSRQLQIRFPASQHHVL